MTIKHSLTALACLAATAALQAHQQPKDKAKAGQEEKKEIVIEKKSGGKQEKMVIEIDGQSVTINGKPADEYRGGNHIVIDDDIVINGNVVRIPREGRVIMRGFENRNRALLGVTTEKHDKGARIESVSPGSGAEKAGLKAGDIITEVGGQKIAGPAELTDAVTRHKPDDEVDVVYLRDGKSRKVKAKLGRNTEPMSFSWNWDRDFNFNMRPPRLPEPPALRYPEGEWFFGNNRPKYGMSIQDSEDGNGVKVISVEEESAAAKGGLKKDDIITEVEGEKVGNVDEVRGKLARRNQAATVSIKVLRDGRPVELTLRTPRRIRTAEL